MLPGRERERQRERETERERERDREFLAANYVDSRGEEFVQKMFDRDYNLFNKLIFLATHVYRTYPVQILDSIRRLVSNLLKEQTMNMKSCNRKVLYI